MSDKKVLVINVGGSHQPIIESLKTHKPDIIYFIPSEESRGKIAEIINQVYPDGFNANKHEFVIKDHNNLISCYKQCFDAFESINKAGIRGEDITVDLTGGTKQMSAALALAATEQGLKISYIGGKERTKEGLGVVINGQEKVYHCAHPFDILAKSEKERFCQAFNSYRFTTAIDICNHIINKSAKRMSSIFKGIRKITDGYRDWDLFRYESCTHILQSGLNSLQRLNEQYLNDISRLESFIEDVKINIRQLENTLEVSPKDKISMEMADELVANALRRAEESKYDDAVARLYRALEMIAQAQFVKLYKQSTSKFPYDKLCDELKPKLKYKLNKDRKVDLGCRNAFEHLYYIDNDFGKCYMANEEKIKAILNQRNESIMAHGVIPLNKDKFENLYGIFAELFKIDGKKIKFAQLDPIDLIPVGIDWESNEHEIV